MIDAETGETLTEEWIEAAGAGLAAESLVFLPMTTTVPVIARYLAALRLGKPVVLLERNGEHAGLIRRLATDAVHPDLALLLSTSGSTGNPRLVRLSGAAVLANAEQIADSLSITADEVAITTLPLSYAYGLSVLNSHLLRGATVVLERTGLLRRDFWTAVAQHGVTSMALVPYQYEILRRLRFEAGSQPTLRTLTQAGGGLRTDLVTDFAQRMAAVGGQLIVMYGQTEAGPRMAILPPHRLADKPGSVGLPLTGGSFEIVNSEVVYRGPNVMMGYAMTAADLAKGDELGGVLHTGDLGRLDDEGFLYLTGRIKRIGKVFGVRINLDDVERSFPVAAVSVDDRLHVFVERRSEQDRQLLRSTIARWLGTHREGVVVQSVDRLPLLPTGKIDYRMLATSP